ncbi:2Fe-2S iron-sulfur cluster binding domain-containing protein, partial [Candidatus Bathyarchaeota archaeon]|nr:2Fe-2S iron-sulfur cluster binding domain-containing protein [Candidatus Bathyarchaeota archaeon]NIW14190.1 2Fe-2S iron-sulfur cluster binding domain-containing protein [Candidatus Thorarchaeota archaeon]
MLLDAIREAGIRIESICGGKGECGKCKVILNKGEVSSLSTSDKKHLSPQQISEGYRLACQIRVLSDSEFTIPVESRIERPKILLSMEMVIDRIDPASKKYLV